MCTVSGQPQTFPPGEQNRGREQPTTPQQIQLPTQHIPQDGGNLGQRVMLAWEVGTNIRAAGIDEHQYPVDIQNHQRPADITTALPELQKRMMTRAQMKRWTVVRQEEILWQCHSSSQHLRSFQKEGRSRPQKKWPS